MGIVMKWAGVGLKDSSMTALNLGMTVVIEMMNGMGVIHLVYVLNLHVHLYMILMGMALLID